MRTALLVASVVALFALFPITHASAQSPGELQSEIVFAPNAIRTVTFSREGIIVASFEVPNRPLAPQAGRDAREAKSQRRRG
jgi:hypothetical protein